MPTYECLRCGTRVAADDPSGAFPSQVCPSCGGPLRDLALPQE